MGACVAVQIQYKSSTNRPHRSLAAPAARPVGLLGWGLGNGVWLHLLRRGGGFSVQSASPAPHRALSARPHSSSQLGSGRTAEHMGNRKPPGAAAGGWVACLTPLGSTGHLTCSSQHATSPQPPAPEHLVWAGCFLPVLCTILLLIGSARYLCGMEPRTNTPGHSRVWHMVPILMVVQKKKRSQRLQVGFEPGVTKCCIASTRVAIYSAAAASLRCAYIAYMK